MSGDEVGYLPGDWFAVLGPRVVVLLPPSERPRVADLWGIVDEGAAFDEVLDALIAGGLRELPGFVLATRDPAPEDGTRVVVRGDARAAATTAEGEVEVAGPGAASTWADRTLTGVSRLVLETGGDPAAGPERSLDTGLVRVSRVSLSADPSGPSDSPEGADEEPAGHDSLPDTGPQTVLPGAAAPPGPIGPEPAGPPTPTDPPVGLPEDAPTQAGPGWSTLGELLGDPVPADEARPVARLVFSHGEEVVVDRAVLVGRSPDAARLAPEEPRLVTVPSPAQEVSGSHLEVRPGSGAEAGRCVATDLGSTNGTVLVQPGRSPEELRPGLGVPLETGAVLDLGDGVTIRVVDP